MAATPRAAGRPDPGGKGSGGPSLAWLGGGDDEGGGKGRRKPRERMAKHHMMRIYGVRAAGPARRTPSRQPRCKDDSEFLMPLGWQDLGCGGGSPGGQRGEEGAARSAVGWGSKVVLQCVACAWGARMDGSALPPPRNSPARGWGCSGWGGLGLVSSRTRGLLWHSPILKRAGSTTSITHGPTGTPGAVSPRARRGGGKVLRAGGHPFPGAGVGGAVGYRVRMQVGCRRMMRVGCSR